MQAVILAAGLGTRLGPLTKNSTKCMVELQGRRLVEYTFDGLVAAGVERVVLVVGHGADEVRSFVGRRWRGIPIEYVENPEFACGNNSQSLLLARAHLEAADTLLLESDVVFDPELLADCVRHPASDLAVVAPYEGWMNGTSVLLDEMLNVTQFVPGADAPNQAGPNLYKTVNVYKLSRAFSRERFMPRLAEHVQIYGPHDYYEKALERLVATGAAHLVGLPTGNRRWFEVDDADDLAVARAIFAGPSDQPGLVHARFGGFWRFPWLKDFTYLANPYFPPPELLAGLASSLDLLARQYPSGQAVQQRLAARVFGCEPSNVVVGNGASELIQAALMTLEGRIGVPLPTFEEYPRLAGAERLVEIVPRDADFRHTVDDLAAACEERALSALVLANPNNPTGQFVPREQVLDLADRLARCATRLIVDESFVDLVDGDARHSLLSGCVGDGRENVIVLRSFGKSYGVPGLRLGALGSANTQFVEQVRQRLPIWNVNSVAEGFLQRLPAFERAYRESCVKLAAERAYLFGALRRLTLARPVASRASFVLCEVTDAISSSELVARLLDEHRLLVKECSGKRGFGSRPFVRVAVRSRADNDVLLDALATIQSDIGA